MSPSRLKYKALFVVALFLFAVVLCGVDHVGMISGDAGHGQSQEEHGCSSDPYLRLALEGISPAGVSGMFLLIGLLYLTPFLNMSLLGFDTPSPLRFRGLPSKHSNPLYQLHGAYRI